MVWLLVFFLMAVGVAQGADSCREKCCQESRVESKPKVQEIALHPETPLDALLPSCHLSEPIQVVHKAVPEDLACNDESTPSCCHLGKAGTFVQALVSKSQFGGTNRLFHMDLVIHVQPWDFFNEYEARLVVMGRLLHPRAAPVPLYLKNTSFIC